MVWMGEDMIYVSCMYPVRCVKFYVLGWVMG